MAERNEAAILPVNLSALLQPAGVATNSTDTQTRTCHDSPEVRIP